MGETLYVNNERKRGEKVSIKGKTGKRKLIKKGLEEKRK
jgi:hypothetical protein